MLVGQVASGQLSDTIATAIKALLLEDKVAEKIFFKYEGEGEVLYSLPAGNYAFISPDSTFQKVYRGILKEFPYTLVTDSLVYKKKFYKDSERAIYINGTFGYELMIVFKEISVVDDLAKIVFFTTSAKKEERYRDRYVLIKGYLTKENGRWRIDKYEIDPIEWVEFFKKKYYKR